MARSLANMLVEAELLDQLIGDHELHAASMDRYGADLLGRAIGHEQAYEARKGLPPTMFYSNLIHELPHTATRKIMAFTAAREVMAL